MAANNGERRPYLSLSGPKKICPAASPIILAVKPNCTNEGVVLKYSPIEGRLGRYMSVTKGPNAVNIPNRVRRKNLEFPFLLCMSIIFFLFYLIKHAKVHSNEQVRLFKISVSLVIIGSFSISDFYFFTFPSVTEYENGEIVFIILICVSDG